MSSNLPPGVTDSMIPGNTAEDMAWQMFHELLDEACAEHGLTAEEAAHIWRVGLAITINKKRARKAK